ncbi:hypothetical protein HNQ95_004607 [Aminobacter ciceronei]|uniref:Uncharacterized protein n=1 Tax=Aminobacter ciceronei TaxID=150723 RepID=A0ABR6CDL8_9HYPH|nr:hypothetical protein [Aminobacter ciceronei]MBA9022708.1 hypothetical protein [Aminobacter ciceronei]
MQRVAERVEDIPIKHTTIAGQFVAQDESAVGTTCSSDLADGVVAEAEEQMSSAICRWPLVAVRAPTWATLRPGRPAAGRARGCPR